MTTFAYQPKPFSGNSDCPCHQVLAEARHDITALSSSAASVANSGAEALAMASRLVWEGNAGRRFHANVDKALASCGPMELHANQTSRFANGEGALL